VENPEDYSNYPRPLWWEKYGHFGGEGHGHFGGVSDSQVPIGFPVVVCFALWIMSQAERNTRDFRYPRGRFLPPGVEGFRLTAAPSKKTKQSQNPSFKKRQNRRTKANPRSLTARVTRLRQICCDETKELTMKSVKYSDCP